jgi:hypothetical protein
MVTLVALARPVPWMTTFLPMVAVAGMHLVIIGGAVGDGTADAELLSATGTATPASAAMAMPDATIRTLT